MCFEFCVQVAKQVDVWLNELGAQRLMPLSLGDEDPAGSEYGSLEMDFHHWCDDFTSFLTTGPHTKTSVNKPSQVSVKKIFNGVEMNFEGATDSLLSSNA